MIRFGPAGNSISFYQEGYKHTFEAMAWLKEKGLNAFEYSFGRGVRIKEDTARRIGEEAKANKIQLSVHAPYYINLANQDEEKFEKNIRYFMESAEAATWLDAKRVVFHPGSPGKQDRGVAFTNVKKNLLRMIALLKQAGYAHLLFCPETMGKINQIGNLEEIIALVNLDEILLPTIDFGHLHTRGLGSLNSEADFERVLSQLKEGLPTEKFEQLHIHFSKIEYTKMGEKQHKTFADEGYGPDFENLAPLLVKYNMQPIIICESKGTMAEDANTMKTIYEKALEGAKHA